MAYIEQLKRTGLANDARTLDEQGNETLAGKLTLGADPTSNMDAVTKRYVDGTFLTDIDSNDIEDALGYVPADEDDVYDKSEVNDLIGALVGVQFSSPYASPSLLPVVGDPSTIYLVENSSSEENVFDEYLWINLGSEGGHYELIGSTEIDLSGYATTQYVDTAINTAILDAINGGY